jgi:hypothetical protein
VSILWTRKSNKRGVIAFAAGVFAAELNPTIMIEAQHAAQAAIDAGAGAKGNEVAANLPDSPNLMYEMTSWGRHRGRKTTQQRQGV